MSLVNSKMHSSIKHCEENSGILFNTVWHHIVNRLQKKHACSDFNLIATQFGRVKAEVFKVDLHTTSKAWNVLSLCFVCVWNKAFNNFSSQQCILQVLASLIFIRKSHSFRVTNSFSFPSFETALTCSTFLQDIYI